jgi:choline kinase
MNFQNHGLTPSLIPQYTANTCQFILSCYRNYKKVLFRERLLEILRKLQIRSWTNPQIAPEDIVVTKVSGALTNAVFFVSRSSAPSTQTLLLRVYGPSSGSLISRPRELHTLHILSSRYKIGPRVYGTFDNGRIEEYFDSVTLTSTDIRDPQISRWIGARMAELHSVDVQAVDDNSLSPNDDNSGMGFVANVRLWLGPAEEVLRLSGISDATRQELDLPRFRNEWNRYLAWLFSRPRTFGTRRVFSHNDAQYGNILRLKDGSEGLDEHRQVCRFFFCWNTTQCANICLQIVVVDFEYAAPNAAAFDIANHFIEWTADYHCPTPHLLNPSRYPTVEERHNFYASYIQYSALLAEDPRLDDSSLEDMITELDRDVLNFGAASHGGWAIWSIVQAREDVEAGVTEPEFDYVGYAKVRMAAFRKDLQSIGL